MQYVRALLSVEYIMWVEKVERVIPCISDPWKLRVIVHLNRRPDLSLLARYLDGRYSQRLGVVMIRSGRRDLSFYSDGKVTVREVDDVNEAETLVNHLLNLSEHRRMVSEEW